MRRKKSSFIAGVIFGPLFVVIGYVVAFVFGKPILDNARKSVEWPSVTGTIRTSEVQQNRDSKGKTQYSADVRYTYEVEGRSREGDTVWFGGDFSSSSSGIARETVSRYPVGKTVDVYYNPEDPTVSVLEPGAFFSSYLVFGIGLVFLAVGLLVAAGALFKLAAGGLLVGALVGTAISTKGRSQAPEFDTGDSTSRLGNQGDDDDGIQIG